MLPQSLLFFLLYDTLVVFALTDTPNQIQIGAENCGKICGKTYSLHTYPTAEHLECCKRGCRLFMLIHLVYDVEDLNSTKDVCISACKESYNETAEYYACHVGCSSLVPVPRQEDKDMDDFFNGPILYIQTMCKRISGLVTSKWTIYLADETANNAVVRSPSVDNIEPQVKELKVLSLTGYQIPSSFHNDGHQKNSIQKSEMSISSACLFDFLHFLIFKVLIILVTFLIIITLLTLMRIAAFEAIEKKYQKLSLVESSEYLSSRYITEKMHIQSVDIPVKTHTLL